MRDGVSVGVNCCRVVKVNTRHMPPERILLSVNRHERSRNAVTRVDVRDVLIRRDVSNTYNHHYSVRVGQVRLKLPLDQNGR